MVCLKTEILRRAFGREPFTVAQARELWGIRSVDSTLHRLKEAGVIARVGRGVYRITSDETVLRIGRSLEQVGIQGLRRQRGRELSELAARRWQDWLQSGYVTRLGVNRFRVNPPKTTGGVRVRIR